MTGTRGEFTPRTRLTGGEEKVDDQLFLYTQKTGTTVSGISNRGARHSSARLTFGINRHRQVEPVRHLAPEI
jgi:hypothetical protein